MTRARDIDVAAGTTRRDWSEVAWRVSMTLLFSPLVLFFVAVSVDLTSWLFTGHEVFPWIGKGLNG